MSLRLGLPFLLLLTALGAADKKLPTDEASNENLEISATPIIDKEAIKQELGSDLGGGIVLIRVKLRPVTDKPLKVDRDDFLLVSFKDGQRSQPFAPSQIAGSDTLMVVPEKSKGTASPGWSLGGLATIGGIGAGNKSSANSTTTAKADKNSSPESNSLLKTLRDKILPEKDITEPISGLLYFPITGKIKPKDLELRYKGPGGDMAVRFHQ